MQTAITIWEEKVFTGWPPIDSNTVAPLAYYIDFSGNTSNAIQVKYFYINFDNKVMSINFTFPPTTNDSVSPEALTVSHLKVKVLGYAIIDGGAGPIFDTY